MTVITGRFLSLPKWAQDEITRLRRTIQDSANEISLLKGETPSRVNVTGWDSPHRPLGDHATVSFELASGGVLDCRLEDKGTVLRLSTGMSRSGLGSIRIWPTAPNCFRVYAER